MVKVVHVINSLGQGGAERSLAELLPYLERRGVDSTVVCLERRVDGFHDEVVEAGFEVRVLPSGGMMKHAVRLRRSLRELRPDLLHTSVFDADIVGRLAAAGRRVPVVGSIVNVSYDPIRLADPRVKKWKLEGVRTLDGWTARRLGDHFHALTEAVKLAATRDLGIPEDRITVIPRGRDPKRLGTASGSRRARTRAELGIPDDAEVIINVGRLEYQKGQRFLIEAMDQLRRRGHAGALLLLVGREGAESAELGRLVGQLGLQSSVRFLGHRDDVPDLLASADVFAFPSLYEGFGGALIEAMALEVPIVASDLPPLREVVVSGAGRLVPAGSSDALADAIAYVLEDSNAADLLRIAGRRVFEERYTLDAVADAMVEMYRSTAL